MSAEEVTPHLSLAPPQSKATQLMRPRLPAEMPHSRVEEREPVLAEELALAEELEVQEASVLAGTLEDPEALTWKVSSVGFSAAKAAST
jgi:hypothetical protein